MRSLRLPFLLMIGALSLFALAACEAGVDYETDQDLSGEFAGEELPGEYSEAMGNGNGNGRRCQSDSDCRLFSSYCETDPCVCFALHVRERDPKCRSKNQVNCFVDPCADKTAVCDRGACTISSAF